MRADLHNHTVRCNHATGTVDQYVEKAIEHNIDVFGFACHAPMEYETEYRMSFEEMETYEKDVLRAREKYAGEIHVALGYEVDFLEGYMDERVLKADVDYLIGSVHFINGWGVDNPESVFEYIRRGIDDVWFGYFMHVEQMAKSGKFDVVGHIDLIKIFNYLPQSDVRASIENALKAIKQSNMVIEINASGLRKPIGEQYPSRQILEMAYGLEIPITFGSDAHSVDHIGLERPMLEQMAKEIGYTKNAVFRGRDREMVKF